MASEHSLSPRPRREDPEAALASEYTPSLQGMEGILDDEGNDLEGGTRDDGGDLGGGTRDDGGDLGGGVGDNDDLDTITPKVGMEFPTQVDAHKYYNRKGRRC